jgi:hypothetical protein
VPFGITIVIQDWLGVFFFDILFVIVANCVMLVEAFNKDPHPDDATLRPT